MSDLKPFREWFAEKYPGCDAFTRDTREPIWFAKAGEHQDDAFLRLFNAFADYLDVMGKG